VRQVYSFEMGAIPPYSFKLTVNKPAGWWWATTDEIYEEDTLWTATRFEDRLIGSDSLTWARSASSGSGAPSTATLASRWTRSR
jgi:hypothetical protein